MGFLIAAATSLVILSFIAGIVWFSILNDWMEDRDD